ncbi:MAG: Eco57I restriction-modification methylase domain-containing protein [Rubrobacteraceae bacterium]|nr:SAM-dependent DNA methyltransferase [Rubrobacter sp.]
MEVLDDMELARLEAQVKLDRSKTPTERNRLGQFATPTAFASEILECSRRVLPPNSLVRFLDPALGTGSFYSALRRTYSSERVASAVGYEVDPLYGEEAARIWNGTPIRVNIADFTKAAPPLSDTEKANLLICNPPYVRHHYIGKEEKMRLQQAAKRIAGVKVSGLAGLYCYFLLLSHAWMASDGVAGWLIPSEFMDVGYGGKIKDYLLDKVKLLRVHRFDPTEAQFEDALVSSTVLWFENSIPPASHSVEFTFGGTLLNPKTSGMITSQVLRNSAKWTAFPLSTTAESHVPTTTNLGDLFYIKRGIATGANDFFVLKPQDARRRRLPEQFLMPVLPSPRYLPVDEVGSDDKGDPLLERKLFLLSCDLPESVVRSSYPDLWRYLQEGVEAGISERYLCKHRSPWYSQEKRPPAPFLCTYMNRRGATDGKLFRFLLNHSNATAPNVYLLLYPKPILGRVLDRDPELLRLVWAALNSITPEALIGEGRVYGGGLHKIEPKELGNTSASALIDNLPQISAELSNHTVPTLFAME